MESKSSFKFSIVLSWSKIMSLLILVFAFILEMKYKTNGSVFMYAVPFSVALLTGKQLIDGQVKKKEIK